MKSFGFSLGIVILLFLHIQPSYGQKITTSDLAENQLNAFQFRCVGPSRGGRVTAVAGVNGDEGLFYMGSTGGGVWKTTDYGSNWSNISDGFFSTASIGAIRVAPSNPSVIYVGTGSDGIRSNVITGKGVYGSLDAGKTWKHLGLEKAGQIGAVEVHPENKDVVFVAAIGNAFAPNPERGVYRSRNGGATWDKVLFVSDSTGAVDLEFAPNNPEVIYAAMWRAERKPWTIISGSEKEGGIYKSQDGGNTWKKLTEGLPLQLFGKCDLAVSMADPNRLYALIEAPEGVGGLYRSDDQGAHFTLVSTMKELLDRPFYYCNVDADPSNANIVYVNSTQAFKSVNGGNSWSRIRTPHGDNHDMWINPNNAQVFIQANDGGVNITRDGGKTWSSQNNQPTAELYQVEIDDQYPYWLYAGQQDNTTIMVPSLPPYESVTDGTGYWQAIGGCETGPAVPKPGNPNIIYSNCKGRFGVYNKLTGQEFQYYVGASNIYGHDPKDLKFRFQRVAPIYVSKHNPDVVYHGSQYLHKTTDDGKSWEIISPDLTAFEPDKQVISGSPITRDVTGEEYYSTIYEINESPIQEGQIWVGANDGPVHVTMDGGKTWQNVTPKSLPPGGRIDCIEPSPHKANKAYFCSLLYQLGDWQPYIYKTEDYGKTWKRIGAGKMGLPADHPVRVIREDPNKEGVLYAGTEFGLFVSIDDGNTWASFQQNLPVTPVTDIKIKHQDLVLSTMGRSFWILDDLSAFYQMQDLPNGGNAFLYKPQDAIRIRYRRSGPNEIPNFPDPGMYLSYYLNAPPKDPLKLEIFNEAGDLVRSFLSSDQNEGSTTSEERNMQTGFLAQGGNQHLPVAAGVNRFRWDMRHKAGDGRRSGPFVAPGNYEVVLTLKDMQFRQSFKVLPDPRLAIAGVTLEDLKAQEILALKVAELNSKARKLASSITSKMKASSLTENNPGQQKLNELNDQMVTQQGRYMTPMLLDQLSYLMSMLDQADQRPGKDAEDRYVELLEQYNQVEAAYKTIERTNVSDSK